MADVPVDLKSDWLTGKHVGQRSPVQLVEYREGRMKHRYEQWDGPPVSGYVAGGLVDDVGTKMFWQKFWTPLDGERGEFTELPNVLQVDLSQDFDNNGVQVATIQVENIAYPEVTGPNGTYHQIKRGYYAPYRGLVTNPGLPLVENGQTISANDWSRRLTQNGQITVRQGYGSNKVPTFTGVIDDIDSDSDPTRITITARDYGQYLTDMRVFGWNKEPRIKVPVTFIDSLRADNVKKVGYDASASSADDDGHRAGAVLDDDSDNFWRSEGHDTADFTEYIQIKLPHGSYQDFYEYPRYRGMDLYVSLYAENRDGAPATRNGEPIPEGWLDLGHGDVPGANGGVPYVKFRQGVDSEGQYVNIDGATYLLGEGSILRLSWRGLSLRSNGKYHAAMNRFFANRRVLTAGGTTAKRRHWIVIDDVADMVKWALRWAGFKEWDVESTGVRLKDKMLFDDKNFLIDIIKKAQDLTGYVFFIKEPTEDDTSIGVPCFRRPVVIDQRIVPRALVQDDNLLEDIQYKDTDEPRAYIIRARGRTATEAEGGIRLDGDRTKRLMYVYRPPWWRRLGGVVKHVVQNNPAFKTMDDCKFACYYIALQEALESEKANFQCAGYPGFELDTHAAVMDVGTGLAQRLWIAQRQSTFRGGEDTTYTMTISGSLVDTPDMRAITTLIRETPRSSEG